MILQHKHEQVQELARAGLLEETVRHEITSMIEERLFRLSLFFPVPKLLRHKQVVGRNGSEQGGEPAGSDVEDGYERSVDEGPGDGDASAGGKVAEEVEQAAKGEPVAEPASGEEREEEGAAAAAAAPAAAATGEADAAAAAAAEHEATAAMPAGRGGRAAEAQQSKAQQRSAGDSNHADAHVALPVMPLSRRSAPAAGTPPEQQEQSHRDGNSSVG